MVSVNFYVARADARLVEALRYNVPDSITRGDIGNF
jgi:hypothetical protein